MTNGAAHEFAGTRRRHWPSRTYRIRLVAEDVGRLCGAAQRRGNYPETLLTAIARTVLREALVDAVLDDTPDGRMQGLDSFHVNHRNGSHHGLDFRHREVGPATEVAIDNHPLYKQCAGAPQI
jgi:hypothetical protein